MENTEELNNLEQIIKCLMRQTNYTEDEARISIEKNKTIEKCIQEYLGIQEKNNDEGSMNQKIYKSIREYLR
jgi:hypothetical protein